MTDSPHPHLPLLHHPNTLPPTAKSRGYAFLEFADKEVAAIVAETMNGYYLSGRKLVCHALDPAKAHPGLFDDADKTWRVIPWRRLEKERRTTPKTEQDARKCLSRLLRGDSRRRRKLAKLGIDYAFEGYEAEAHLAAVKRKKDDPEAAAKGKSTTKAAAAAAKGKSTTKAAAAAAAASKKRGRKEEEEEAQASAPKTGAAGASAAAAMGGSSKKAKVAGREAAEQRKPGAAAAAAAAAAGTKKRARAASEEAPAAAPEATKAKAAVAVKKAPAAVAGKGKKGAKAK